ncbi:MAG: hypothetical protein JSW12_16080 [Deltaproteobacteria bacterium]|nr:MAG: hypothetical protein JSW12_16080 [Deltaproteobacteria bacterium]
MNRNRNLYMPMIGVVLVFFISGCALYTRYGKIRPQPWRGERITIHELQKNWEDYTIHYAGLSVGTVAGIMFDPKNDERSLTGDRWIKVEDQQTLSELIGWMKTYYAYNPQIYRILGPDNQFYGYLYYPHAHNENAVVKVVDDTTMYVYGLESPTYFDDFPYRKR